MLKALFDIAVERHYQIEKKGYDSAHDDSHVNDELAAAACFYAMPEAVRDWDASSTGYAEKLGLAVAPEGWGLTGENDRRRELVKAGALILAEIDRIDRAARTVRSGFCPNGHGELTAYPHGGGWTCRVCCAYFTKLP